MAKRPKSSKEPAFSAIEEKPIPLHDEDGKYVGVNYANPGVDPNAPIAKEKDLPVITTLGICKVKQKFALITVKSQGKKVLEVAYGEPAHFNFALEDFKLAMMKEYEAYFDGKE